ncbi:hypothetical protein I552_6855 [Mycobacterium xenopi 3993]|nr:hypothetical protein I552_6855 [Mycobacterium xenopi 3993]
MRHPHVGALLEALDQRHHRNPGPQLGGQLGEHVAKAVGRNPMTMTSAVLAASEKSVVARSDSLSTTSSPR